MVFFVDDTDYPMIYLFTVSADGQTLPGVWSSDAHIQFEPTDGHWFVSAYVRNIEDNRTPNYSSTHPSASILIAGTTTPRTFGMRAGIKF